MLMKSFQSLLKNKTSSTLQLALRSFSSESATTDVAKLHQAKHTGMLMDPKFYKDDVNFSYDDDVGFVRSPFYDLARYYQLNKDEASDLVHSLNEKVMKLEGFDQILGPRPSTKDTVAYVRYADNQMDADDKKAKEVLQFPRGQPYRIVNNSELYKIPKTNDHFEQVKRSKSYIAETFFGPFELKEGTLKQLFYDQKQAYLEIETNTPAFEEWREKVIHFIPNLNHDQIVILALHLAYDAKLNDKWIWKALEEEIYKGLHQMNNKQICQLEWAIMEMKPKYVNARLNNMLVNKALEVLDKTTNVQDIIDISQGFRKRQSKDMYMKMRKALLEKKSFFFQQAKQGEELARYNSIVNTLYTFASNKPTGFGVYREYAKDDLNELLSHYEEDLKDMIQFLDAEHLTRLAQALYVLKTVEYEHIFERIEFRANELIKNLDHYHVTNILRSLARSQENKSAGKDKTFFNFEPVVLKNFDKISDRDLTHLMYSYGLRNTGNPELHQAFEKKIPQIVERLDYASLFNLIYYLLFREIHNKQIWQKVIDTTVNNPQILPLIYYRPFKASKIYLENKFPDLDLTDYNHKFWYAERYFNVHPLEENIERERQYYQFKGFLNTKVFLYPVSFQSFHNLFILHYVFNEQKIAINFHLEKFMPSEKKQPTEMQKLAAKVLKHEGWEVLDLSEHEFKHWTYNERINNIKGWVLEAKARQVKKGIIPAVPPKYV